MVNTNNQATHLCYENKLDVAYVKSLIRIAKFLPLLKYNQKYVLYAFVIPLNTNHDNVLVKFGYTKNIIHQFNKLKNEYKSGIYLIGLNIINDISSGRNFYELLESKYNELNQTYIINNKNMKGLYKLSPSMIIDFLSYPQKLESHDTSIETHIQNIISVADSYDL